MHLLHQNNSFTPVLFCNPAIWCGFGYCLLSALCCGLGWLESVYEFLLLQTSTKICLTLADSYHLCKIHIHYISQAFSLSQQTGCFLACIHTLSIRGLASHLSYITEPITIWSEVFHPVCWPLFPLALMHRLIICLSLCVLCFSGGYWTVNKTSRVFTIVHCFWGVMHVSNIYSMINLKLNHLNLLLLFVVLTVWIKWMFF